ncbi:MAG: cobalamin biosynthesis protein, partial [Synechococcaceae bacterium WB7_3xG_012]|nr:cobalamin biosynthesis protein [Synechococcaceae bacterium WB7_3xG_012]
CLDVQLGGVNRYGERETQKPLLAAGAPAPETSDVERLLGLSRRLEVLWLAAALLVGAAVHR